MIDGFERLAIVLAIVGLYALNLYFMWGMLAFPVAAILFTVGELFILLIVTSATVWIVDGFKGEKHNDR